MYLQRDQTTVGTWMVTINWFHSTSEYMVALMGWFINKSVLTFCALVLNYSFSRKVIWLEVATTNKDSSVIAGYYLRAVEEYGLLLWLKIVLSYNTCRFAKIDQMWSWNWEYQNWVFTTIFKKKLRRCTCRNSKLSLWQISSQSGFVHYYTNARLQWTLSLLY